jgi:hypothetical protein
MASASRSRLNLCTGHYALDTLKHVQQVHGYLAPGDVLAPEHQQAQHQRQRHCDEPHLKEAHEWHLQILGLRAHTAKPLCIHIHAATAAGSRALGSDPSTAIRGCQGPRCASGTAPRKHTLRSLIHITAASEPMRLKLAPTLLQSRIQARVSIIQHEHWPQEAQQRPLRDMAATSHLAAIRERLAAARH